MKLVKKIFGKENNKGTFQLSDIRYYKAIVFWNAWREIDCLKRQCLEAISDSCGNLIHDKEDISEKWKNKLFN